LTPGQDYFFVIAAYNAVGLGPNSEATKLVAGTVPEQPPIPTLVARTESSIHFSYSPPPDYGAPAVIGYYILWNGGSGSSFTILSTNSDLSLLEYQKSADILGGVTYEFKIVALNIVGESVPSPIMAILAAQPPTAPLQLQRFIADKTSISVQWQPPESDGSTAITGYNLYWDNATGNIIQMVIGTTSWQTLSFSLAALTTNRYYKFGVTAVNSAGEGPMAVSDAIITATVPGQPQTPALKSSSKVHIEVMWSDPLDLGGTTLDTYIIEMDQGSSVGPDNFKVM
jgi:hypothetical protein